MKILRAGPWLRLPVAVLAFAWLTLIPGGNPEARQKFYIGGGLTTRSASGDFDGTRAPYADDPINGPFVYPGNLAAGNGLSILGGVVPQENLAVEFLLNITSHDSSHANFGGDNLSATVFSLLFAARGLLPITEGIELFGRAGLGPYAISYDGNTTLTGSSVRLDSTFTGFGAALGGGVVFFVEPFGIEVSYTLQKARFDQVEAADRNLDIPTAVEKFGNFNLILTINFGDEV